MKKINIFHMVIITLFIIFCMIGGATVGGNWHIKAWIPYYPHIQLFRFFLFLIIILLLIVAMVLYIIHRKKEKKYTDWNIKKGLLVFVIDALICIPLLIATLSILPVNLAEKSEYHMHEKVTVNDITYSITSIETIAHDYDDTLDIVKFNIKIENNSQRDHLLHLFSWELIGKKDNRSITPTFDFEETSNRLTNGTIYAKETWEGVVAFEIPKESQLLQLDYHSNPYSINPPTFSFIIEE